MRGGSCRRRSRATRRRSPGTTAASRGRPGRGAAGAEPRAYLLSAGAGLTLAPQAQTMLRVAHWMLRRRPQALQLKYTPGRLAGPAGLGVAVPTRSFMVTPCPVLMLRLETRVHSTPRRRAGSRMPVTSHRSEPALPEVHDHGEDGEEKREAPQDGRRPQPAHERARGQAAERHAAA